MREMIVSILRWFKKYQLVIKIIFFALVLFFVALQVTKIAQDMSWQTALATIKKQDHLSLLAMLLIGSAGVLPMLLYDATAVGVLQKPRTKNLTASQWLVSAWITNTLNNLAGFGGIIGVSLRSVFYGRGLEKKLVLGTVSKIVLFMLSGLSFLALFTGLDLYLFHRQTDFSDYRLGLVLGGLYGPLLLLFVYSRRKLFKEFGRRRILQLFAASFGQWLGAVGVFLAIGFLMGLKFDVAAVYRMFIVATGLGMLTMVPGGAGTFDVMMILGLGNLGFDQSQAVVWILFYRIFYYLIPFLSGLILFLSSTGVKLNRYFDNLPRLLSQKAAHLIVVGAVYFAGIMMVLLSTVTNLSNVSSLFRWLLPFSFDFLDQTLNLLIGFLLLGLARAVAQKVKKAFWPTILLLGFGILNTVLRTASLRLIAVYLLVLLAVWLARKEFYREKLVYSWGGILFDGVLFGALFIIYAVAGYYSGQGLFAKSIQDHVLVFPAEEIWISGMIGVAVSLWCLALLYQYLSRTSIRLGTDRDDSRLAALEARFGGTAASHYLRLPGYRYYHYLENGEHCVTFGFQFKGNKCFVLGDPIGDQRKWKQAVAAFMTDADRLGYQLAFYKTTKEFVVILHDLGFLFDKVGENAVVDLTSADTPAFAERFEFKKLSSSGYRFQYYEKLPQELLLQLQRVSDAWLGSAAEKYYGVGRFDAEYLQTSGVGIAFNAENDVVGFITKQPITKRNCSYDLLRVTPKADPHIGDFLLAHLLDVFKAEKIERVDLGMAPLANVGDTAFAFFGERLLNVIYRFGNSIYAFQQVTAEKNVYVDSWEARYFAYMKQSSFFFSALQLLQLLGRGKNKGPTIAEDVMIEVEMKS